MALLALSLLLAACGGNGGDSAPAGDGATADGKGEGEPVTLKFAHEEGDGDVQDLYAHKFKELIEEQSDGRFNVDVYTAGTLGTNMDVLQSLQTGAIEIAITSP